MLASQFFGLQPLPHHGSAAGLKPAGTVQVAALYLVRPHLVQPLRSRLLSNYCIPGLPGRLQDWIVPCWSRDIYLFPVVNKDTLCFHVMYFPVSVPWNRRVFSAMDASVVYISTASAHPPLFTLIGSRPSDHYFRSVCWFVCLFVQSFSQPSLIRFWSN